MEISWRARVVLTGSAMIGTVIGLASTTETTGGGGVRAASSLGEHPGIATETRAIPKTIPPRLLRRFKIVQVMMVFSGSGSRRAARPDVWICLGGSPARLGTARRIQL